MEPKKYEYIDSLRGIAVLLVICSHVALMSPSVALIPYKLYYFMERGIHGVQLFFLVSAFTLTMSYYNRKGEKNELKSFFIRRFFRIAPMYYLAIIYFTFAIFLKFSFTDFDWSAIPPKGIISSFLFANGLFPAWINSYVPGGWSITVEFMFYFMLPFICRLVTNVNRSLLFVYITLLLASVLNTVLEDSSFDKYDFLYYYLPNQLPVFALGILAYWITKEGVDKIITGNILLLATTVFIYCFVFSLSFHILYSLVFFILLLVLSKKPYKLFSNKIMATIGKCSFSMYLVHFAILGLLNQYGISYLIKADGFNSALFDIILMFLFIAASAFIISYLTYKFIEVPGQNLGRKLIKKINTKYQ